MAGTGAQDINLPGRSDRLNDGVSALDSTSLLSLPSEYPLELERCPSRRLESCRRGSPQLVSWECIGELLNVKVKPLRNYPNRKIAGIP